MTGDQLVCRHAGLPDVWGLCRGPVDQYLVLIGDDGVALDQAPVCRAHADDLRPRDESSNGRYELRPIVAPATDIAAALTGLTGPGSRFTRGDQYRLHVIAETIGQLPKVNAGGLVEALQVLRDQAGEVLDLLVCTVLVEWLIGDRWEPFRPARSLYWPGSGSDLADSIVKQYDLVDTGPAQWRVTVYAGDRTDRKRVLATVTSPTGTIDNAPPV